MPKQTALTFFLLGLAFAQWEYPSEVQSDDAGLLHGSKVNCMVGLPKTLLRETFDVEPPLPMESTLPVLLAEEQLLAISSAIRETSVILDGML